MAVYSTKVLKAGAQDGECTYVYVYRAYGIEYRVNSIWCMVYKEKKWVLMKKLELFSPW